MTALDSFFSNNRPPLFSGRRVGSLYPRAEDRQDQVAWLDCLRLRRPLLFWLWPWSYIRHLESHAAYMAVEAAEVQDAEWPPSSLTQTDSESSRAEP